MEPCPLLKHGAPWRLHSFDPGGFVLSSLPKGVFILLFEQEVKGTDPGFPELPLICHPLCAVKPVLYIPSSALGP